jgi:hypothetical protein
MQVGAEGQPDALGNRPSGLVKAGLVMMSFTGSSVKHLMFMVILVLLTVVAVSTSIPARKMWHVSARLEQRISGIDHRRPGRFRAQVRMFPSLYLSSISFLIGIWLVEAYSGFTIGRANQARPRWHGPNTFVQYIELYGGLVFFMGLMFAFIAASVSVYWFNWPRRLVAPKLRGDLGMAKIRRGSGRSTRNPKRNPTD